jgi:hypothetical protein
MLTAQGGTRHWASSRHRAAHGKGSGGSQQRVRSRQTAPGACVKPQLMAKDSPRQRRREHTATTWLTENCALPRKVSPSMSGRCCPLYFVVHWFSAHVIALAVSFQRCTRHRFVAVACVAVWSSPCANARQTIRRVFMSFRRVSQAHGIGRISGSGPTMLLHIMHEHIE